MKISSTFEQGIYVVIILALEQGHKPVKSSTMSGLLEVSDSYLKKILRKLSQSGLVISSANRRGGYVLSRPADQISLKDVFTALGEEREVFVQSGYAEKLFPGQSHVKKEEAKIEKVISGAVDAFLDQLDQLRVSELLLDGAWQNGAVDWETRLEKQGSAEPGPDSGT